MFYLVRHGQADYSEHNQKIYQGAGVNLAPLSKDGVEEIEYTAHDDRLQGADLIISSPYTRALETAAILSRVTGTPITVETDLHEWLPDKHYAPDDDEKTYKAYTEYASLQGKYPQGEERDWEEAAAVKARIEGVLERYKHLGKVIVVTHGMAIHATTGVMPANGEIVEYALSDR